MKKNYVKPSVKVKNVDMQSLLASESGEINSKSPAIGLDALGGYNPGVGVYNDGTHPVCASQNLWIEEEEEEQ